MKARKKCDGCGKIRSRELVDGPTDESPKLLLSTKDITTVLEANTQGSKVNVVAETAAAHQILPVQLWSATSCNENTEMLGS